MPKHLGSKGVYEVSHEVDLSSKVDALSEKFDKFLSMNRML